MPDDDSNEPTHRAQYLSDLFLRSSTSRVFCQILILSMLTLLSMSLCRYLS